jgi:5-hydroxyisourate hydrolase-like protein (transthyretin family)
MRSPLVLLLLPLSWAAGPEVHSKPDPVSSHILDTTLGRPAAGVAVTMSKLGGPEADQEWTKLATFDTNLDGRASGFLSWENFTPGTYKMHFATGQYWK